MDLSHALIGKIDETYVTAPDGDRCRLRFVSAEQNPPAPLDPIAADITVETDHNGQHHRVTSHLSIDRLSTVAGEQYVVEHLREGMRQVLAGELPPGTRMY